MSAYAEVMSHAKAYARAYADLAVMLLLPSNDVPTEDRVKMEDRLMQTKLELESAVQQALPDAWEKGYYIGREDGYAGSEDSVVPPSDL